MCVCVCVCVCVCDGTPSNFFRRVDSFLSLFNVRSYISLTNILISAWAFSGKVDYVHFDVHPVMIRHARGLINY